MIRRECEMEFGSWPVTVKQLLRPQKTTQAVWKFLATTRVGEKPLIERQEQKEKRRRYDEA